MNKEENNVIEEEEFPYVPKDLIERLEDIFDIRKMIWYEKSNETLLGIQQVVTYLRNKYDKQNGDN
jgi:hypothetical protein|nr:MAG TPA: hypothetical protein [Caudoviricetes sp.]